MALFGSALGLAHTLFPLQVGPINDYGQTLNAEERAKLLGYIAALEAEGVQLVYLASWRDPFGDPKRYALEVFRAWRLSERHFLLVFVRDENRRWYPAFYAGKDLALPKNLGELLAQAEFIANRTRPGSAAVQFVTSFLAALLEFKVPKEGEGRFPWKSILFGILGFCFLVFVLRRVCPRCGWKLGRRRSVSGIILVCSRCRYTRAGLGWGRWPGRRRGFYP